MLKIGEIVQTVKGIVETRVSLVKQEIQEEFVSILSRLVLLFVVGSMIMMSFIFLSLSLAFYLSQVTQSPYLGFFIVALIYLLAVIVLYVTRDSFRLQKKAGNVLDDFIFKSRKRKDNHE
ncbi:phage holin family protein [Algoriphagus mannitolivorans]|uniref:phage holin family protein n=1 Tax=Algoriphagus mannitolivorans TaxID=226504 RepID=UPI00047AC34B|nr:phage holin family protein [Algoriphagus mannitolivorans]